MRKDDIHNLHLIQSMRHFLQHLIIINQMFCGLNGEDPPCEKETKKIENYIYNLKDQVGKGNFSEVFKGIDQFNGKSVAIKVIKHSSLTSRVAEQLLKTEIQILKELNHENVLKYHQVLCSKNNCYIITDFYQGGDLEKKLHRQKRFLQKDINRIVYDVFQGLLYLNGLSVVHRDLKVANIFLTSNGISKIADFGFAIKSSEPFKDIKIGSPIYMSPEGLLLNEYGPKTDIWSFGVLIYELLHGDTPLANCRTQKELKERVLLPPIMSSELSLEVRNFINLCLTVDPKHRPFIQHLREHPYLKRIFMEVQKPRLPKQMSSTMYTNVSDSNILSPLIAGISTYEEGLSILHYCRLIHKTCELESSPILSQWLLNISCKLQCLHFNRDLERNEKLKVIIVEYYNKYKKKHQDNKIQLYFDDVIREAKRLLNNCQSRSSNFLKLLVQETEKLHKFCNLNQINLYAKNSQIEDFLKNKNTSTGTNFFLK